MRGFLASMLGVLVGVGLGATAQASSSSHEMTALRKQVAALRVEVAGIDSETSCLFHADHHSIREDGKKWWYVIYPADGRC